MRKITLYAVVKLTVEVVDNTATDAIIARVASDCDYKVQHQDDVCQIVGTELVDVADSYPV